MKYNYFLASRYRNKEQLLKFAEQLRAKGKTVYCFIESPASIKIVGDLQADPESSMQKFEAIKDWPSAEQVREIFETDMDALRNSESLILYLPAGKSSHIEAGVAYGLGKETILIGEQKETESLYLIFNRKYQNSEDFINSL